MTVSTPWRRRGFFARRPTSSSPPPATRCTPPVSVRETGNHQPLPIARQVRQSAEAAGSETQP